MSESFKNKNSENESSYETDFYDKYNEVYKFAKIFRRLDEHQKELVPLGYPVVGEDGKISIFDTSWTSEPEKMPHSELELCSYVDESGGVHSINLHAYGAYDMEPTMIAVETVTGVDGEVRLGSEPAVLVTELDITSDGHDSPLTTDNGLTSVLYELFGDDVEKDNSMKDMRNFLAVTMSHESADPAQYEAFMEKMITRFRQRDTDSHRAVIAPTSEQFWRAADAKSTTSDKAVERKMQDEVYRDEQEMLDKTWRQKGKLGRFAARVRYIYTDNGKRDVRTY